MGAAGDRRIGRGVDGLAGSGSARRGLRLCRAGPRRGLGVTNCGDARSVEDRRNGALLFLGERRRHLRPQPFHRCDDRRSGGKRGASPFPGDHGGSGGLRLDWDGNGLCGDCPYATNERHHDFRNDSGLLDHRPVDDFESDQLLHFLPAAERADLRSSGASGWRSFAFRRSAGAVVPAPGREGDALSRRGDRPRNDDGRCEGIGCATPA